MAPIDSWLGAVPADMTPASQKAHRAVLAWRRIQDKKTSIVFRTPAGATLAAQDLRVESDSAASMATSAAGAAPVRRVVVFGVKDHPQVADTDIKEGYRFVLGADMYVVRDVIETIGEVQGIVEAQG